MWLFGWGEGKGRAIHPEALDAHREIAVIFNVKHDPPPRRFPWLLCAVKDFYLVRVWHYVEHTEPNIRRVNVLFKGNLNNRFAPIFAPHGLAVLMLYLVPLLTLVCILQRLQRNHSPTNFLVVTPSIPVPNLDAYFLFDRPSTCQQEKAREMI